MILLFAFIVGVLTNLFILYYEPGLGFTLAIFINLGFVLYTMKLGKRQFDRSAFIKLAIIVLLSGIYIVRNFMVFKVLTIFLLPFLFASLYVPFNMTQPVHIVSHLFIVLFRPFGYIHHFVQDAIKKITKGREEIKYIVYGVLIAFPFLLVVVPLLISSDLIVLDMFTRFVEDISISGGLIFRYIFVLALSSFIYGHFVAEKIKNHLNTPLADSTSIGKEPSPPTKSHLVITTFLIIINGVYAFYVYIQLRYLFIQAGSLPEGISYAEYAREGFFELLTVAILNILAIIGLELLNAEKRKLQRALEEITLICTFVMSISAFYRMSLYENIYGFTVLRLLVYMFLIFLMGFILLVSIYLITYNPKVMLLIIAYSIVFYIGSAYYNVEGHIAEKNIERDGESDDFDFDYLLSLSPDAYPVIEKYFDDHPEKKELPYYAYYYERFEDNVKEAKERPWQEFTILP